MPKTVLGRWGTLAMFGCLLTVLQAVGFAAPPEPGAVLADFALQAPATEQERTYLGVQGPQVRFREIQAEWVLLEIVGVYCPRCYEQAPALNTLFKRLERGQLGNRLKLVAVAAGATPMEVEMVSRQWRNSYPVIPDPTFAIHKLLGEPRTPFVLLVDNQGRVRLSHKGVIENVDRFYQQLKKLTTSSRD